MKYGLFACLLCTPFAVLAMVDEGDILSTSGSGSGRLDDPAPVLYPEPIDNRNILLYKPDRKEYFRASEDYQRYAGSKLDRWETQMYQHLMPEDRAVIIEALSAYETHAYNNLYGVQEAVTPVMNEEALALVLSNARRIVRLFIILW